MLAFCIQKSAQCLCMHKCVCACAFIEKHLMHLCWVYHIITVDLPRVILYTHIRLSVRCSFCYVEIYNRMRTNVLVFRYRMGLFSCIVVSTEFWEMFIYHLWPFEHWDIRLTYTNKSYMMEIPLLLCDITLNPSLSDCNGLLNWTRLINEHFPRQQRTQREKNNKRPVVMDGSL